MCRVYNAVGCLTALKAHLNRHNITEFRSVNELIAFQDNYGAARQRIIRNSEIFIENEKNTILSTNRQLENAISIAQDSVRKELGEQIESLKVRLQILLSSNPANGWQKLTNYFKIALLNRKIRKSELNLQSKVFKSVSHLIETHKLNEDRYNYILSSFQDAVMRNCSGELYELQRKKNLIDEVKGSIYGAIGEQKVVKELEKLSDEYILINDFSISFNPPIYNRSENDHIMSIQVDHLLVGRSGVFIIETKNWSQESLNNLSLRSPVSQIKRTSFALFLLLNKESAGLSLGDHHWGRKKIALKNIIVMINSKPAGEFQYVKVLTLNQLVNYIEYFPPTLTRRETEDIADELLRLAGYPAMV